MKKRGEEKVWKSIQTKKGNPQKIISSQIGQQILFSDALNILSKVKNWIQFESGKSYRKELENYFDSDDFLLQKITESLLLLVGSIQIESTWKNHQVRKATRHRRIRIIQEKVLPNLPFDIVWRFLEVIISFSDFFEVLSEKEVDFRHNRPSLNLSYKCTLSETILNKLAKEAHSAFFPEPMTTKPLDWEVLQDEEGETFIVGGYENHQYDLVRVRGKRINYLKYGQPVFDAVNYIQSVPWKVNLAVYEQITKDLREPKKEDYVKTYYPEADEECHWEIKLDESELSKEEQEKITKHRHDFQKKVKIHKAEKRDFESALGKYRAVKLALSIAENYLDGTVIYFPHSYDFRGRIYPIPVGLSPQGSDAVKAMLEYAEGERLTVNGEKWMWAYLATLYGDDKIPFDLRIQRGKELLNIDYKEADEPYQFLAHQLEIKKWLKNPQYKVKARIHLDACNSGSQFTSSITGDRLGCIATNVIPTITEEGQERKDTYELVAHKALHTVQKALRKKNLSEQEREKFLFYEELLEKHGRAVCKRPVMVSNYGGTAGGRTEIIWNLFREMKVDSKWINRSASTTLSKIIGDSIVGTLTGGKAFEKYIQKMNNVLAKRNRPVIWQTSDGFFVVHKKNKELKKKQITCVIPGSRRLTTIYKKKYSPDLLSAPKMRSAVSPNFIHSLDAELLRYVALSLREHKIFYSDFIHDSFGCHANHVDKLLETTKEEFLNLIKRKPLELLDKQLRRQAGNTESVLKQLQKIEVPNLGGFDVDDGDLDVVMKSDWFFS